MHRAMILITMLLLFAAGNSMSKKDQALELYSDCINKIYLIEFKPDPTRQKDRCDYDPFNKNSSCGLLDKYGFEKWDFE